MALSIVVLLGLALASSPVSSEGLLDKAGSLFGSSALSSGQGGIVTRIAERPAETKGGPGKGEKGKDEGGKGGGESPLSPSPQPDDPPQPSTSDVFSSLSADGMFFKWQEHADSNSFWSWAKEDGSPCQHGAARQTTPRSASASQPSVVPLLYCNIETGEAALKPASPSSSSSRRLGRRKGKGQGQGGSSGGDSPAKKIRLLHRLWRAVSRQLSSLGGGGGGGGGGGSNSNGEVFVPAASEEEYHTTALLREVEALSSSQESSQESNLREVEALSSSQDSSQESSSSSSSSSSSPSPSKAFSSAFSAAASSPLWQLTQPANLRQLGHQRLMAVAAQLKLAARQWARNYSRPGGRSSSGGGGSSSPGELVEKLEALVSKLLAPPLPSSSCSSSSSSSTGETLSPQLSTRREKAGGLAPLAEGWRAGSSGNGGKDARIKPLCASESSSPDLQTDEADNQAHVWPLSSVFPQPAVVQVGGIHKGLRTLLSSSSSSPSSSSAVSVFSAEFESLLSSLLEGSDLEAVRRAMKVSAASTTTTATTSSSDLPTCNDPVTNWLSAATTTQPPSGASAPEADLLSALRKMTASLPLHAWLAVPAQHGLFVAGPAEEDQTQQQPQQQQPWLSPLFTFWLRDRGVLSEAETATLREAAERSCRAMHDQHGARRLQGSALFAGRLRDSGHDISGAYDAAVNTNSNSNGDGARRAASTASAAGSSSTSSSAPMSAIIAAGFEDWSLPAVDGALLSSLFSSSSSASASSSAVRLMPQALLAGIVIDVRASDPKALQHIAGGADESEAAAAAARLDRLSSSLEGSTGGIRLHKNISRIPLATINNAYRGIALPHEAMNERYSLRVAVAGTDVSSSSSSTTTTTGDASCEATRGSAAQPALPEVKALKASIDAHTLWGALHGLTSFSAAVESWGLKASLPHDAAMAEALLKSSSLLNKCQGKRKEGDPPLIGFSARDALVCRFFALSSSSSGDSSSGSAAASGFQSPAFAILSSFLNLPSASAFLQGRGGQQQGGVDGGDGPLGKLSRLLEDAQTPLPVSLPLLIVDAPWRPWRGLSVDTGRHFMPLPSLLRTIDGMALSKLNVFHWHIGDAQSWPLQLNTFPSIAKEGSWSFPAKTYTTADVVGLVAYAAKRGIRVIPEVDAPAHARAFTLGSKGFYLHRLMKDGKATGSVELRDGGKGAQLEGPPALVGCHRTSGADLHSFDKYALNPASNISIALYAGMLAELSLLFPDRRLHIGADEVAAECWGEVMSSGGNNNNAVFRLDRWTDDNLPNLMAALGGGSGSGSGGGGGSFPWNGRERQLADSSASSRSKEDRELLSNRDPRYVSLLAFWLHRVHKLAGKKGLDKDLVAWEDSHAIMRQAQSQVDGFVRRKKEAAGSQGSSSGTGAGAGTGTGTAPKGLDADFALAIDDQLTAGPKRSALLAYTFPASTVIQGWKCWEHHADDAIAAAARDVLPQDASSSASSSSSVSALSTLASLFKRRPVLQSACTYLDYSVPFADMYRHWPLPEGGYTGMGALYSGELFDGGAERGDWWSLWARAAAEASGFTASSSAQRFLQAEDPAPSPSRSPSRSPKPTPSRSPAASSSPGPKCHSPFDAVHSSLFGAAPLLLYASAHPYLGGEAAVWSERIDADSGTLECRTWPRAGAVAEVLWSSSLAYDRFARAALSAAPVMNPQRRLQGQRQLPTASASSSGEGSAPLPVAWADKVTGHSAMDVPTFFAKPRMLSFNLRLWSSSSSFESATTTGASETAVSPRAFLSSRSTTGVASAPLFVHGLSTPLFPLLPVSTGSPHGAAGAALLRWALGLKDRQQAPSALAPAPPPPPSSVAAAVGSGSSSLSSYSYSSPAIFPSVDKNVAVEAERDAPAANGWCPGIEQEIQSLTREGGAAISIGAADADSSTKPQESGFFVFRSSASSSEGARSTADSVASSSSLHERYRKSLRFLVWNVDEGGAGGWPVSHASVSSASGRIKGFAHRYDALLAFLRSAGGPVADEWLSGASLQGKNYHNLSTPTTWTDPAFAFPVGKTAFDFRSASSSASSSASVASGASLYSSSGRGAITGSLPVADVVALVEASGWQMTPNQHVRFMQLEVAKEAVQTALNATMSLVQEEAEEAGNEPRLASESVGEDSRFVSSLSMSKQQMVAEAMAQLEDARAQLVIAEQEMEEANDLTGRTQRRKLAASAKTEGRGNRALKSSSSSVLAFSAEESSLRTAERSGGVLEAAETPQQMPASRGEPSLLLSSSSVSSSSGRPVFFLADGYASAELTVDGELVAERAYRGQWEAENNKDEKKQEKLAKRTRQLTSAARDMVSTASVLLEQASSSSTDKGRRSAGALGAEEQGRQVMAEARQLSEELLASLSSFGIDLKDLQEQDRALSQTENGKASLPVPPSLGTWSAQSSEFRRRAAAAGFAHSRLLQVASGYHIALLSSVGPISVVLEEDGARPASWPVESNGVGVGAPSSSSTSTSTGGSSPHFQRGLLVADVAGIRFAVAHLNAHEPDDRLKEAKWIRTLMDRWSRAGIPSLLAGDLNSLSPLDAFPCHHSVLPSSASSTNDATAACPDASPVLAYLLQAGTAQYLRHKFLANWNAAEEQALAAYHRAKEQAGTAGVIDANSLAARCSNGNGNGNDKAHISAMLDPRNDPSAPAAIRGAKIDYRPMCALLGSSVPPEVAQAWCGGTTSSAAASAEEQLLPLFDAVAASEKQLPESSSSSSSSAGVAASHSHPRSRGCAGTIPTELTTDPVGEGDSGDDAEADLDSDDDHPVLSSIRRRLRRTRSQIRRKVLPRFLQTETTPSSPVTGAAAATRHHLRMPRLRIDNVLLNAHPLWEREGHEATRCRILDAAATDRATAILSDHYPVLCEMPLPSSVEQD